ncbi:MAG: hypothetical protein WBN07_02160 [Woeseiaceae bacterium]
MINYLAMGAEKRQEWMELYGGVQIQYRRPGSFSFNIVAVPGRNPTDVFDQNGTVLRAQVQDFIVDIARFRRLMSTGDRPLRGDEILMEVAGQTVVFLVTGEDIATSHYEPADSYGVAWRIHTRSDRILTNAT